MMNCYHFTADTLRNGDPIPPIGQWLEYTGEIVPCKLGLHASTHPFDALTYAPGNTLHRVKLDGELQSHGDPIDKWVGRRRKIIATINAEPLLHEFARWCASSVLHLWDAPQVVRDYLETGDEAIRAVAWDAARAVARDAAWAAAWDAARAAAWAAAWDAAWAAAWDAAWAAAWAAARAAAWSAARDAQRDHFAALVEAAFARQGEMK